MLNLKENQTWGIVLCAGGAPEKSQLQPELLELCRQASYCCAADSGYLHAEKLGLKVDFIVGDMDSLKEKQIDYRELGIPYRIYHEDKDFSDTELAFEVLLKQSCQQIVLIGGGRGRIDQLFGHFHHYFKHHYPQIWLSDIGQTYHVDEQLVLSGLVNRHLGVFTLERCQLRSRGLRWPLELSYPDHSHHAISNIIDAEKMLIKVLEGRVLVSIAW